MLNFKNYNIDYLYNHKTKNEYRLKLQKRNEINKISILSDTMFKAMFQNENRIKFSCKFLSYFLDIEYEYLLKNLKLSKNETDKEFEIDKGERCDYVATIDDTTINIEVNNNDNVETMNRNIEYAYRQFSKKVKVGKEYNYAPTYQFNVNNFSFEDNDKTIDYFFIQNQEGTILSEKICFVMIYVPNIREKWYNEGIESLTELERYILTMVEQNIDDSYLLGKGEKIMEEYIDEAVYASKDNYIGESYDKEWALKDQAFRDGMSEGYEEGIEKGIKQRNVEIAKIMLAENTDIEYISRITELSIDEIKNLRQDSLKNLVYFYIKICSFSIKEVHKLFKSSLIKLYLDKGILIVK